MRALKEHWGAWGSSRAARGAAPSIEALLQEDVHDCGLSLDADKHPPNIFRLSLAARTRLHNTKYGHLTLGVPQPIFPTLIILIQPLPIPKWISNL